MAKKVTVAEFLTNAIKNSGKTQVQIAKEIGYNAPNIIAMMRQGQTKLPVSKVSAFAKALKVDPAHLLRIVLSEYLPETWEAIQELVFLVPANEQKIFTEMQKLAKGKELKLSERGEERAEQRKALLEAVRLLTVQTVRVESPKTSVAKSGRASAAGSR